MAKKVFLVLLGCVCLLSGCWESQENAENTKHIKKDCSLLRYVRIGEHILKFAPDEDFYIQRENKIIPTNCLQSSPEKPVEVDEIKLFLPYEITGYPKFAFRVTLAENQQPLFSNREMYNEMIEDLNASGRNESDLAKFGKFYGYRYSEHFDLYRYFSLREVMKDVMGVPIMLEGCPHPSEAMFCRALFRWKRDVKLAMHNVYTYKNAQERAVFKADFEIWEQLYPMTIRQLDAFLYTPSNHEHNGDKQ